MADGGDTSERALVAACGVGDIVVRADARGFILYISDSCRAFGYEPAEIVGQHGAFLVHPDDLARFADNSARLFERVAPGQRVNREFRYRRKDGTWAWLEGHPTILPSFDGRLGDVLNVFCDVTARREMSEALKTQARLARTRPA
ncbi:PAS domain-containing protein [Phenylobacterium sp.]|uniref:PAS domain-containing protein n=1 Tax=Phenylobacterium sp. TaxID=1871053 RepID=UPI0035650341